MMNTKERDAMVMQTASKIFFTFYGARNKKLREKFEKILRLIENDNSETIGLIQLQFFISEAINEEESRKGRCRSEQLLENLQYLSKIVGDPTKWNR